MSSRTLFLAAALLVCFTAAAEDEEIDQDAAVAEARETPIECANLASFKPLFDLSASGQISDPDPSRDLAQANEEAFLKCPYRFLYALKDQPRETQDGVVEYFGKKHSPAELGAVLAGWKNNPYVGPLVRGRFSAFLGEK